MKIYFLVFYWICCAGFPTIQAQNNPAIDISADELESYKLQLNDLVNYLEGTLNFLGDRESPPREKEIVVNSSYLKIFKNEKVQIEDDLDDFRDVPLHKDVQAYLKDISFFYRTVSFHFIILDITHFINEKNEHYFKITFNRDMEGITVAGDSISSRKLRYMEVNLDVARSDLRIASIYTTPLNQREENRNWWNKLPRAWQQVFGNHIQVFDSLLLSDIRFIGDDFVIYRTPGELQVDDTLLQYRIDLPDVRQAKVNSDPMDSLFVKTGELFIRLSGILKLKQLDISYNKKIQNLDPLSALSDLEAINCSGTLITSLFPLRNLNKLRRLDFSDTPVGSLSALYYSTSIEELNCSRTLVSDLSFVINLYQLRQLDCAGLRLQDIQFIEGMDQLKILNASKNSFYNLEPLRNHAQLENLDISNTWVQNLDALEGMEHLQILDCDHSPVRSVEPLVGLPILEFLKISYTPIEHIEALTANKKLLRIYWDSGPVYNVDLEQKKEAAIRFMKERPDCLVIFESEELINGWKMLEPAWKEIATQAAGLSDDPGKEELHGLLKIESINLENSAITTLEPIGRLYNLKTLNAAGVNVENFEHIGEALDLEYLDLSRTPVSDLGFASKLYHLQELHLEKTAIRSLTPLDGLNALKYVYATGSGIDAGEAFRFRKQNPACLVIFMGDSLNSWWQQLPENLKTWFTSSNSLDSPPSIEQLHALMYSQSIAIEDFPGTLSLRPLLIMHGLTELKISGSLLEDVGLIEKFPMLKSLSLTGMPLAELPISQSLPALESLNLENTSVFKLKFLDMMPDLKNLNISGTPVRSLSNIKALQSLERIEFSNTAIKNIHPLDGLSSIQSVYCFNTRISSKNIEKFKALKPDCKVVYY